MRPNAPHDEQIRAWVETHNGTFTTNADGDRATYAVTIRVDPYRGVNSHTKQFDRLAKADIAKNDYDLSVSRYREVVYEAANIRPPKEIIAELKRLENEISVGLLELERLLGR